MKLSKEEMEEKYFRHGKYCGYKSEQVLENYKECNPIKRITFSSNLPTPLEGQDPIIVYRDWQKETVLSKLAINRKATQKLCNTLFKGAKKKTDY